MVICLREALIEKGHQGKIHLYVVDLFPGPNSEINYLTPETFKSSTQKFDCVIASAVLEHLTNMPEVLEELYLHIAPAGVFYARTPFEVPLVTLLKFHKIRWPRHLYDLGCDFWNKWISTKEKDITKAISRPSLVETSFASSPIKTLIAYIFKAIYNCESNFIKPFFGYRKHIWNLVGGWEVFLIRK